MTAPTPDGDAMCRVLLRAVTVIQRKAAIAAEIQRLQDENATLDAELASSWPDQIDTMSEALRSFAAAATETTP